MKSVKSILSEEKHKKTQQRDKELQMFKCHVFFSKKKSLNTEFWNTVGHFHEYSNTLYSIYNMR